MTGLSDYVDILFDWSLDAKLWTLLVKLPQLDSTCRSAVAQMWQQTGNIEIRDYRTISVGFQAAAARRD